MLYFGNIICCKKRFFFKLTASWLTPCGSSIHPGTTVRSVGFAIGCSLVSDWSSRIDPCGGSSCGRVSKGNADRFYCGWTSANLIQLFKLVISLDICDNTEYTLKLSDRSTTNGIVAFFKTTIGQTTPCCSRVNDVSL